MSGIKQKQEQEQDKVEEEKEEQEGEEQSGELSGSVSSPPPVSCGPFATCCGNRGVIINPSLSQPPISIVIPVTSSTSKRVYRIHFK
ncbi:hypothetical protein ACLKA7_005357 [Drosophila subpalustris]